MPPARYLLAIRSLHPSYCQVTLRLISSDLTEKLPYTRNMSSSVPSPSFHPSRGIMADISLSRANSPSFVDVAQELEEEIDELEEDSEDETPSIEETQRRRRSIERADSQSGHRALLFAKGLSGEKLKISELSEEIEAKTSVENAKPKLETSLLKETWVQVQAMMDDPLYDSDEYEEPMKTRQDQLSINLDRQIPVLRQTIDFFGPLLPPSSITVNLTADSVPDSSSIQSPLAASASTDAPIAPAAAIEPASAPSPSLASPTFSPPAKKPRTSYGRRSDPASEMKKTPSASETTSKPPSSIGTGSIPKLKLTFGGAGKQKASLSALLN
ncbi:hypothetical protein [Phaffia rhodozyma]|uniref:Uncharacterized protein n=1 Tax=Phaffia rhodozyma TaxID=264483 RepID=A0A0F7SVN8_PHARH|nr:hypothetical protein [Phaffia rhodozyma]